MSSSDLSGLTRDFDSESFDSESNENLVYPGKEFGESYRICVIFPGFLEAG